MVFFKNPEEELRKQNLQSMEDARLRFAEKMQREGFAPQRMLLLTTDQGGYAGLCRHKNQLWLILSPDFGKEGEFSLYPIQNTDIQREDFFRPAEGMGGAFGIGKKGETGFNMIISLPNGPTSLPFITNRTSAAIAGPKNPLLSTKRRRGNANLAWDFKPVDKKLLEQLQSETDALLKE